MSRINMALIVLVFTAAVFLCFLLLRKKFSLIPLGVLALTEIAVILTVLHYALWRGDGNWPYYWLGIAGIVTPFAIAAILSCFCLKAISYKKSIY